MPSSRPVDIHDTREIVGEVSRTPHSGLRDRKLASNGSLLGAVCRPFSLYGILGMLAYHEAVRKQGASYARKSRPDQHRAHLWRQCRNRFAGVGGWPVR
jgi:hypothetical protein